MVNIIIMAKAPQPGLAKTRLIPALGENGAAQLAKTMLLHTITNVLAAEPEQALLCITPDPAALRQCDIALPQALTVVKQGEGDLGERMANACRQFNRHNTVEHTKTIVPLILVGTDCPALTPAIYKDVTQQLLQHDVCMVPAMDGGYVLLGLAASAELVLKALFDNIPWGGEQVAALTRARCVEAGISLVELSPMADIDRPDDLQNLPREWLKFS